MLGMSLSHSLRQVQRVAQSLRLNLGQRLVIQQAQIQKRLDLIHALRGDQYRPEAKCPQCARKLTALEIIRGFLPDPNDFTTACTGCDYRFQPSLICRGRYSSVELPFFCAAQTLPRLAGKENLAPDEFAKVHPAIYHSAIVHYGGLAQAFQRIGRGYPFNEINDWRDKVGPFLGHLTDRVIAECAGVSATAVSRLRRARNIRRYRVSQDTE